MRILENLKSYSELENMGINDVEQQDRARQKAEFKTELYNSHLI